MDELIRIIKDLQARIEILERASTIRKITIPTDGKLVVDSQASDPTVENGRIYYNTATNKYKVCENGVWKTITTT
jgi:hypothetical protein